MKTTMLVLAAMFLMFGVHCAFAAEKDNKLDWADKIAGQGEAGSKAGTTKNLAAEIAAQNKKLMADLRSGAQKDGGMVTGVDGVSHVIEAHSGNCVEREYYTNSCSVSSTGRTVDGVMREVVTVRGDNNKLLETMEWIGNTVVIKDGKGKLIETKTF